MTTYTPTKVTATINSTHTLVTRTHTASSPLSSPSSRIPRRLGNLRMRDEPHHLQPTIVGTNTALLGRQHHHSRHKHLLHSQQQHQFPNHQLFPVITENGTESPRPRSFSLSLTPARPRSGHTASAGTTSRNTDDSDAESVKSYSSVCSAVSACEHATFALNGTTWSGRRRRYIVHGSNQNGDSEEYLTPTQRAARHIRRLQSSLKEAHKEIEEKNQENFRLMKEVVELRLYKASLNSPEERTDSSDAITVRENNTFSPESPGNDLLDEATVKKLVNPGSPEKCMHTDVSSSLADSGHFEDGSIYSKESTCLLESQIDNKVVTNKKASTSSGIVPDTVSMKTERDEERRELVDHYESRIDDMHRRHVDELQHLTQKHNEKVEGLLNQLSEVSIRYCDVRPAADTAEAHSRELEAELEAVKAELNEQKVLLSEQEERNKQMYLKMYAKGQEAARIEQADQVLVKAHQSTPKVTVAELLQQLTVTQAELDNIKDTNYSPESRIPTDRLLSAQEAVSLWVLGTRKAMYRRIVEARNNKGALDPEILLQFLKSAIYYFLTDKENHDGHLNAIESILGFTDTEKRNIDKLYRSAKK